MLINVRVRKDFLFVTVAMEWYCVVLRWTATRRQHAIEKDEMVGLCQVNRTQ